MPYLWGTTGLGINLDQVRQRLGKDAPLASLMLLVVGLFALAAWWRAGRFRQRQ